MKEVFQGLAQRRRKSSGFKDLNNQYLYHLDDISISFGNIKALQSITLTVNPGEILFVTGKSGAGKSTLLNVITR